MFKQNAFFQFLQNFQRFFFFPNSGLRNSGTSRTQPREAVVQAPPRTALGTQYITPPAPVPIPTWTLCCLEKTETWAGTAL